MFRFGPWVILSSNEENQNELLRAEEEANILKLNSDIANLKSKDEQAQQAFADLKKQYDESTATSQKLSMAFEALKASMPAPDPLEVKVTSKYPQQSFELGSYYAFAHPNQTIRHDPRWYLQGFLYSRLPIMGGATINEKAERCRAHVKAVMTYATDNSEYGVPDYLQEFNSAYQITRDDCDGQSVVLAALMLKAGIPYYRIRWTFGNVMTPAGQEGHAYVTLLRDNPNKYDELNDGGWVVVDTTFQPEHWSTSVKDLPLHKDNQVYNSGPAPNYSSVWFSVDQYHVYAQNDFRDKIGPENTQKFGVA